MALAEIDLTTRCFVSATAAHATSLARQAPAEVAARFRRGAATFGRAGPPAPAGQPR